ncbi:alpha-(1-_3)-arabinofuranosyltransferase family protein [Micromonospora phytophila]|uniref:alpha-(1->3)-arabinofuranosyltransferase n=1 Tax=Micromonospora phytophila TaxID=709888 RepID=UPI00202DC52A|nr:alpha-(1->3)-arabinofuranosyltransferase family protein [Micromonospora phytophila]MCM0674918.1 alpha-(1->3)-arabinofuranosyltransferase family protein [Micromonospora phytophila]
MRAEVTTGTESTGRRTRRTARRFRHLVICIALSALAFQQEPGLTVPDTKVDLNVNPAGWLLRSLHLWDPAGTFGQLQNQAYGYLWPMGPFFLVGSELGLAPWVVQRLWWTLLFCVAYLGAVRLAGRLRIGTPAGRMIAAVAFALSPRILTQLGWSSVEAWPSAVAPWVLIPLIGLARGAPLRRAVAGSAVAVACAGGVNATAVFAVVPLALLWLAALRPLRRRLTALAAWCAAVALATAWWLVPLLVLGRYSPPFLDYIESARFTTSVTDGVTVLRGASYWVAYLGGAFGPTLPAGARLATGTMLVVATLTVAGLGVLGLSRRGMPHRRFLVTGLVLGAALVGLGHVGDLPNTFAGPQQQFLDGVGAPLRNVHKFDVLLRLPLALGVAHLVGVVIRAARTAPVRRRRRTAARAWLTAGVAMVAIAGVASPALAGGLATPGSVKKVPGYWHEAADWLDANTGRGRVLVVPGARFPSYDWGNTTDEITQALLESRFAVRNAIPFTPPTTIRLLDAIDAALVTGAGSAGLADLLARSGISHVLFRADLDHGRSDTARPAVVRQALQRSPGLTPVARFGPVRGGPQTPGVFQDHGLDVPVRALEVFRVDRTVEPVVAHDLSDVTTVVGGPESLLDLAAAGQLPTAPTVLAGDLPDGGTSGPVTITDGLRRRDVSFGRLRDNTSATLTADDTFNVPAPAHDYLPDWGGDLTTVARYDGISSIRASSSRSQVGAQGGARPEHQPFAAMDGDTATSWQSTPEEPGAGQWLEVTLANPTRVNEVRVRFDLKAGTVPTKVTVNAGYESLAVESFGDSMTFTLPGVHATRDIRIAIDGTIGSRPGDGTVGISEIEIPGIRTARTLVTPAAPATGRPAAIVVSAAPTTPACFFVDGQSRCSADAARGSEDGRAIDRTVALPAAGEYTTRIWARPEPGSALDAALDAEIAAGQSLRVPPEVSASSTAVPDPAARPGAVLDGDLSTAWSPALSDEAPILRLKWLRPQVITGLRFSVDPTAAATKLGSVRVVGDDGVRGGLLGKNGQLTMSPPMRTDEITIQFLDKPSAYSRDPYGVRAPEPLPVAVGEVTVLPGAPTAQQRLDAPVKLACGSGPSLVVGGVQVRTTLRATVRDLLELREAPAEPCGRGTPGQLRLAPGEQRLVASGSALATPTRLALVPRVAQPVPAATPGTVEIGSWAATERRVRVAERPVDRVLAVRENTNTGWQATVSGVVLKPIVLDGWQQGWLLPAGTSGEVVLRFVPDTTYRAALFLGGVLLLGVVALAVLPDRRRDRPQPSATNLPARRRAARSVPLLVAGAAALVMLGGVVGVLLVVAGLVLAVLGPLRVPWPADPRRARMLGRASETWLPGALMLLAGWLYLGAEQRHVDAGPQLAVVLALGCLWLSTATRRRPVRRVTPPPREPTASQASPGPPKTPPWRDTELSSIT